MPRQLVFDWPPQVSLGAEDFFVSLSNAQAYALVSDPALWPQRRLVLTGPAGSGKTHLARVFQQATGATLMQATRLGKGLAPPPPGDVVIEDVDRLGPEGAEALFHLHNHLANANAHLLLTAASPPARWPITLPDLASRVQAITTVAIADPDDALLAAVIIKHLRDRQLAAPPALVGFLTRRIERSFAAAADIVARLDQAGLAQGREINERLARELLDNDGTAAR
ncbi:MAG: chromosomal replication initiator DnaA [Limimaricola sp.]|uniref:DnaA ATPase domain-containing protein n=1 Tax=Limimaricola sp. TaxID=2211665 RepID=UPI001E007BFC|nr:DnaA/Hda family protein [Limimaricola sp.]MBI1416364.1 chromosomal replication initiator DnaA [Limimaricola sp.]